MDDGIDVLMSGGFRKNGMVEVQLQAKAIDVLLENTEVHFDEYDLLEQVGALEYKTDEITGLCGFRPVGMPTLPPTTGPATVRLPRGHRCFVLVVTLGTSQPHIPACTHPCRANTKMLKPGSPPHPQPILTHCSTHEPAPPPPHAHARTYGRV